MFNPNPAFSIGTKVEISTKGSILGVKADIEKISKFCKVSRMHSYKSDEGGKNKAPSQTRWPCQ
jgi:hypothetical protein